LQAQGADRIRSRQLQKLVAQATANGSDNPLWPAEVGAGQVVSQPGAVIEPVERMIWWQLAMAVLPGSDPWSAREVRALRQAGTVLPEVADRLDRAAHDWLRPVLAAQAQLVLVLPPPGEEVHPLWQMIGAVVEQPRVIELETLLSAGGKTMAPVTPVPLPAPKRWWQLPDDIAITLRPKESFSSLEQLLFNPYQWLLRYSAKLQPSRIVSMGPARALRGFHIADLAAADRGVGGEVRRRVCPQPLHQAVHWQQVRPHGGGPGCAGRECVLEHDAARSQGHEQPANRGACP